MNNKKELTVIIPAYNDILHLDRMLKSLQEAKNNDIATILVINDNDNIQDSEYENLINNYNNMDIKYYRNKENIGVGATRKRGKSIVDTEWFSFEDQDDYVLEGYFDSFLRMRKKEPDKMMMVFPKKVIEYVFKDGKSTEKTNERTFESAIHYGGNFYHIDLFDKFGITMSDDRMSDDIYINTILGNFFYGCFDFIATDEEGDAIYVWEHTNKDSITLKASTEEIMKHSFIAHKEVKEFIEEYCNKNPDGDFVKHWTHNGINVSVLYAEEKLNESLQKYFFSTLSDEEIESIKNVLEARISLYENIEKKIKYIDYDKSELEFLTDIHMAILIEREFMDNKTWKEYWKLQYPNEVEPSMTISEMQKLCDKIRISNAIGAISNGDMEYIKELSFFEILKIGLNGVLKGVKDSEK